jgi:hypothetical protein
MRILSSPWPIQHEVCAFDTRTHACQQCWSFVISLCFRSPANSTAKKQTRFLPVKTPDSIIAIARVLHVHKCKTCKTGPHLRISQTSSIGSLHLTWGWVAPWTAHAVQRTLLNLREVTVETQVGLLVGSRWQNRHVGV